METVFHFLTDITPLKRDVYIMILIALMVWYFAFRLYYRRANRPHNSTQYLAMSVAAFLLQWIRNLLFLGAFLLLALELFNEMVTV